ncbi:GIY-YIG nuclease family protein [Mixta calida]|uniref:GIY-YIG nuclease family protein n=1 Tax=Mixta calida TaxID=665913 RepID=UPI002897116B|nr:GIY-YIG nuclease family protein [Mixta calida]
MTFTISKVKAEQAREKLVDSIMKMEDEIITHMHVPNEFSTNGWVYILSNEAMPGIYKIGMTTSSPEVRAREVSQGTGVPMPYVVEHAFFSDSPREDEAELHEALNEFRINPNREFFKCEMETILDAFSGQGLVERDITVETLADNYNAITFERRKKLNLQELFCEMGITTFGDELALAESLIRLACRQVKRQSFDGYSLLFSGKKVQRVKQEIAQQYEAYLASHPEKTPGAEIYYSPF